MRSIEQSSEPLALRQWKKQNTKTLQVLTYPPPSEILRTVKAALHEEQKGLCAYTLCALPTPKDGHVEHIVPRSQLPNKSLEYSNMVLCFPKNGGDTSKGFGAPKKGGKAVQLNVDFVSPHTNGCDQRFIYKSNGSINAANEDGAARGTIDLLGLNCEQLRELRLAAITAQGLTVRTRRINRQPVRPRSIADAKRLANEVLKPDSKGKLQAFCIAIHQIAIEYAKAESYRSKGQTVGRKKP